MNSEKIRQEQEKEATIYIESNKLDTILTDMMNSVLHSNSDKPIVHMVIIVY